MAASLAEEQGRKQAAAPLPEQPEPELRRRFARSLLLPQVGTLLRLAVVQHCSPADLQQQSVLHEARRRLRSVNAVSLSSCLGP